ncbi:MAG: hypothetical protein M5U28_37310 [Sandaracinaceae bacterium]|nr:hypothetical protein [Sandaracinaceae bacterium]
MAPLFLRAERSQSVPARWARTTPLRIEDWPLVWGAYRPRFDPTRRE